MKCGKRSCFSEDIEIEWREDRGQYLKRCHKCGAATWEPLPENKTKKRRESKHLGLLQKFEAKECQWCEITKELLPAKQSFEAHHIVPYSEGGSHEKENIMILCSYCHADVHRKREQTARLKKIINKYKMNSEGDRNSIQDQT